MFAVDRDVGIIPVDCFGFKSDIDMPLKLKLRLVQPKDCDPTNIKIIIKSLTANI